MQYSSMFYYALLILGFNELGPVNPPEMIFCVLLLLASSLLNALLFSDMAVIVEFLQQAQIREQNTIDTAFSTMVQIGIEQKEQTDIKGYFLLTRHLKDNQDTLDKLIQ